MEKELIKTILQVYHEMYEIDTHTYEVLQGLSITIEDSRYYNLCNILEDAIHEIGVEKLNTKDLTGNVLELCSNKYTYINGKLCSSIDDIVECIFN